MKKLIAPLCLLLFTVLLAMAVSEIYFQKTFNLIDKFKIYEYTLLIDHWHIALTEIFLGALLIIPAWRTNKALTERVLEILIRLGIGGMFIFASIYKISSPKAFAVSIAQYQFLPENLVNLWALVLPQVEFWFGLALIVTPFVKECAWVILGMFMSFIVALIWAIALELDIVCGCFAAGEVFGAQSSKEAWITLVRNLILLVPTTWLLTRKNENLLYLAIRRG